MDNVISWLKGTAANAPLFNKDVLLPSSYNDCSTDEVKILALGCCGKISDATTKVCHWRIFIARILFCKISFRCL